jgi:hypothetical protein
MAEIPLSRGEVGEVVAGFRCALLASVSVEDSGCDEIVLLKDIFGAVFGRLMSTSRTLVLVVLGREGSAGMPIRAGSREFLCDSRTREPVSARIAGSELKGACVSWGHQAGGGRVGAQPAVFGRSVIASFARVFAEDSR